MANKIRTTVVKPVANNAALRLLNSSGIKVTKASVLAKVKAAISPAERAAQAKAAKAIVKAAKPAKVKAKVQRTKYEPALKIKIVEERDVKKGSAMATAWALVKKSKTVGDYLKLRDKYMLSGLGGYFGQFLADGNIKVS